MAETQIEWTDATWNPVAGCSIVTAGCTHCYAMEMAKRLEAMGIEKYAGLTRKTGKRTVWNGVVREDRNALAIPHSWRKPPFEWCQKRRLPNAGIFMLKAALYARYSSDLQSPESIGDQLRICRELATRRSWEVAEIYDDEAISGASIHGRVGLIRLLEDARARRFDILCAEALDRISRDQEDIAHVYKLLRFKGIALHTVAEGQINEMHVGLKGMMNALFLKDLAEKTRRGQRGRVEKGRSGGGLAYGYDVVAHKSDGAGARMINEGQARVIRRIFHDFADGMTPGVISDALNREGVPGPGGRSWKPTTIRGHRIRGTGIINNELYRGVLVWNRQSFVKDPITGKRQARMNSEEDWVRKDVPELRIIDESLWLTVKSCQDGQEQKHGGLRDAVRRVPMRGAPGSPCRSNPTLRGCYCSCPSFAAEASGRPLWSNAAV